MDEATSAIEIFNVLEEIEYGRVTHIEDVWMYSYDPPPLVHTDGERIVFVRFYIGDESEFIRFDKIVDGQQRQYQNSYNHDGNGEVGLFYNVKDNGASTFEFAIYVDGEMEYYDFFHKEEHP